MLTGLGRLEAFYHRFKITEDPTCNDRIADGVLDLQIWKLAANKLNEQLWTANQE